MTFIPHNFVTDWTQPGAFPPGAAAWLQSARLLASRRPGALPGLLQRLVAGCQEEVFQEYKPRCASPITYLLVSL